MKRLWKRLVAVTVAAGALGFGLPTAPEHGPVVTAPVVERHPDHGHEERHLPPPPEPPVVGHIASATITNVAVGETQHSARSPLLLVLALGAACLVPIVVFAWR